MKKIKVLHRSQALWLLPPIILGISGQLLFSSIIARVLVGILMVVAVAVTLSLLARYGKYDEYVMHEKNDDEEHPSDRDPP